MDNLWAPWRMEYILGNEKFDGCIFCPGEAKGFDRDRLILRIGLRSMIIMNRYPYNNGHILVAPVRHVASLDQLDTDETLSVWNSVNKTIECLKKLMNPGGFNVGINLGEVAGAGIKSHLHVHIVPRWKGDTNFMTVTGEIRSIPEHLLNTFDRLRPLIKEAFGEN